MKQLLMLSIYSGELQLTCQVNQQHTHHTLCSFSLNSFRRGCHPDKKRLTSAAPWYEPNLCIAELSSPLCLLSYHFLILSYECFFFSESLTVLLYFQLLQISIRTLAFLCSMFSELARLQIPHAPLGTDQNDSSCSSSFTYFHTSGTSIMAWQDFIWMVGLATHRPTCPAYYRGRVLCRVRVNTLR